VHIRDDLRLGESHIVDLRIPQCTDNIGSRPPSSSEDGRHVQCLAWGQIRGITTEGRPAVDIKAGLVRAGFVCQTIVVPRL
jgi:hypothetical protein